MSSVTPCFACSSRTPRQDVGIIHQGGRGDVRFSRCGACGSYVSGIVFDPDLETARVETQPWGQQDSGVQLNDFKQRMFEKVLQRIQRVRPAPATLLDVGCSFGGFLFLARSAGYQVSGTDIGVPAVEFLQRSDVPAAQAASVCDLPGSFAGFDVVTVLDVNCYWSDQPAELRAIHDRLAPGGLLVMRVVDKSWLVTLGRRLRRVAPGAARRLESTAVNDHLFSMPLRSMLRIVADAGFVGTEVHVGDALHSTRTRWPARMMFRVGDLGWRLARRNVAPGAVLITRKPQ